MTTYQQHLRRAARDGIVLVVLLCTALALPWLAYGTSRSSDFAVDALPVMLPLAGFHELEPLVDRDGSFRWTTASATMQPPNPGGVLDVELQLASGTDAPIRAQVAIGASTTDVVVGPGLRRYLFVAPPASGGRVPVTIQAPTTTVDGRDLGVVVTRLSTAGGTAVPAQVVLVLLLATVAGYLVLRRAGLTLFAAGGVVLVLQVLAVLWQGAGGWQYALFVPLLTLAAVGSLAGMAIERIWPPQPAPPQLALGWTARHTRATLLLVGLALLVCLPWLAAADPVGDMELAARRMGALYAGGLIDAFTFGGDYMPLRLFILFATSQLVLPLGGEFYDPVPVVTQVLIKLPSIVAHLATVALLYWWSCRFTTARRSFWLTLLYLATPPIWINVVWWGQVDALLTLPMLAAVVLLDRARGRWSWLCWALALLVKPQAIILAPLLYVATLRRHGVAGLVHGGAIAVGVLVAACAPFVLLGQGAGLLQAAAGSVGRFPNVTNRAYNLWYIVSEGRIVSDIAHNVGPFSYRTFGALLLGVVALVVVVSVLRRPAALVRAEGMAVLALAFFVLPTQIHERYAFFALPFLALCVAANGRLLVPYLVLLVTATLNIVGALEGFVPAATAVIKPSSFPLVLAWVNIAVLLGLVLHVLRSTAATSERNTDERMQALHAAK